MRTSAAAVERLARGAQRGERRDRVAGQQRPLARRRGAAVAQQLASGASSQTDRPGVPQRPAVERVDDGAAAGGDDGARHGARPRAPRPPRSPGSAARHRVSMSVAGRAARRRALDARVEVHERPAEPLRDQPADAALAAARTGPRATMASGIDAIPDARAQRRAHGLDGRRHAQPQLEDRQAWPSSMPAAGPRRRARRRAPRARGASGWADRPGRTPPGPVAGAPPGPATRRRPVPTGVALTTRSASASRRPGAPRSRPSGADARPASPSSRAERPAPRRATAPPAPSSTTRPETVRPQRAQLVHRAPAGPCCGRPAGRRRGPRR